MNARLFIALAATAFAQQQCYYGPNKLADIAYVPCSPSGTSACCLLGDYCLKNSSCFNPATGITYIAGCTDSSYRDGTCQGSSCGKDTQYQGMSYCYDSSWVCCPNAAGVKPTIAATALPCPCDTGLPVAFEAGPSLNPASASLPQTAGGPTILFDSNGVQTSIYTPPKTSTSTSTTGASTTTRTSSKRSPTSSTTSSTLSSITTSSIPTPTDSPVPPPAPDNNALKIGLGVGIPLGVILIAAIVGFIIFRRRRNAYPSRDPRADLSTAVYVGDRTDPSQYHAEPVHEQQQMVQNNTVTTTPPVTTQSPPPKYSQNVPQSVPQNPHFASKDPFLPKVENP